MACTTKATFGISLLSLYLAGCLTASAGGNDGWLNERAVTAQTSEMARKGMMPATIDCQYSSNGPVNLSKFTCRRAPVNTTW
ncbi:hypothetical protein, partial [Mesorhizobium sp. B2-6-7]|uniref:hypothetical protein n=1 Tax=Mesorhizobium sp. B2-6-7 TaxID=2589910 RepID=UPI001AEE8932